MWFDLLNVESKKSKRAGETSSGLYKSFCSGECTVTSAHISLAKICPWQSPVSVVWENMLLPRKTLSARGSGWRYTVLLQGGRE